MSDKFRTPEYGLTRRGPLLVSDPEFATSCSACQVFFDEGDYLTNVPIGPGSNPERQRLYREGSANLKVIAVTVHWACATGEQP